MSPRLLGTLGMAGALMLAVEGLLRGTEARSAGLRVGTFELLYLGGWMCSLIGMRRTRATGDTQFGRAVLLAQGMFLCLGAMFTIWESFAAARSTGDPLFELLNAAWPLSHMCMIAVGGAALRAKLWRGWRKFVPLLCGLALPVAMLAGATGARFGVLGPFTVFTATALFFLGYAVATAEQDRVARRLG